MHKYELHLKYNKLNELEAYYVIFVGYLVNRSYYIVYVFFLNHKKSILIVLFLIKISIYISIKRIGTI